MTEKIRKSSFVFWQHWLFYSSCGFASFGVVFAIYGDKPLFATYNHVLASLFWHTRDFPPEV